MQRNKVIQGTWFVLHGLRGEGIGEEVGAALLHQLKDQQLKDQETSLTNMAFSQCTEICSCVNLSPLYHLDGLQLPGPEFQKREHTHYSPGLE